MMRLRRATAILPLTFLLASAAAQPPKGVAVNGFGGFFFASENPVELADWYRENLGITKAPKSYDAVPWSQDAGPTIFEPFPAGFPAFKSSGKVFMLNFRTANLDALVRHLREQGNEVTVDDNSYPNGRFAHLSDPEGNLIQLWQPAKSQP